MPAPSPEVVQKALSALIEFGKRVGVPASVVELDRIRVEFQTKKPTLKRLQSEVRDAVDEAQLRIKGQVLDAGLDTKRGKEALAQEMYRVFDGIEDVIYPPEFIEEEMSTAGFKGAKFVEADSVRYMGNPSSVRNIFERSVQLVRNYTSLVGEGNLTQAYKFISPELAERLNFKRFTGEHERASRRYGGSPREFLISSFGWIFPDEESRNNVEVGRICWPRHVQNSVRRATVFGFWVCDPKSRKGCNGGFWITEHDGEFRIAKFNFTND